MFTGSTATGKIVAEACGKRLIGFSAELGGKNPMIVLDDAPLERALQGALAASFSNAGQLCMSIERLYVQDTIYDTFVPAFQKAVSALKLGTALDFSYEMGSLISQAQLDKVVGHVQDAVTRGATVLAGGRPDPTSLRSLLSRRCWKMSPKLWPSAEVKPLAPSCPCIASQPMTKRSHSPMTPATGSMPVSGEAGNELRRWPDASKLGAST